MLVYPTAVCIVSSHDTKRLEWIRFENKLKQESVGSNRPALKSRIEPLLCDGTKKNILLNLLLCSLTKVKYVVIPPMISEDAISDYFENFLQFIDERKLSSTAEIIYYNNYLSDDGNKLLHGLTDRDLTSLSRRYDFVELGSVEEIPSYLNNKMFGIEKY